jgi:pimeloyl-ACP methyl ester carboxylesterase
MDMSAHFLPIAADPQPDLIETGVGYWAVGDGAPVVLLHSSLSSKSQWSALAERLAPRFRVIALDLCGYGDNALPVPRGLFTLEHEVELVAARLGRLIPARDRIHLVGHSYGGLVALRFAQYASDRIASLSVYEPVAFQLLDDEDAALADVKRLASRVSRLVAAGCHRYAAQAFVDFWNGDGSYARLPQHAQAGIARRVDKLPLDFQAASSWPMTLEDICGIAAPTLLLGGKRSPAVVQRVHARLVGAIPGSRAALFDAGHMGLVADAQRINPWIEAFVDLRSAMRPGARNLGGGGRQLTDVTLA